MKVPAPLPDKFVDQGEWPTPDGKAGKGKTGAVLDYLGRLLQSDTFICTHPFLLLKFN
jgi:hypothetical protein